MTVHIVVIEIRHFTSLYPTTLKEDRIFNFFFVGYTTYIRYIFRKNRMKSLVQAKFFHVKISRCRGKLQSDRLEVASSLSFDNGLMTKILKIALHSLYTKEQRFAGVHQQSVSLYQIFKIRESFFILN